jgi:hypothetical protein
MERGDERERHEGDERTCGRTMNMNNIIDSSSTTHPIAPLTRTIFRASTPLSFVIILHSGVIGFPL